MSGILREGSVGSDVQVLQSRLKSLGFNLAADGQFGPATTAAVMAFQGRARLVQDGIAGEKTLHAILAGRREKDLSQQDIERAAAALGVEVAAVLAVNEVESAGSGFGQNGKPKILFERHVFHDLLADKALREQGSAEAADKLMAAMAAQRPDIICAKPGGYIGGPAEHGRLAAAMQVDEDLAIQACSWGAFQIMGYHYKRLGFASAAAMAEAMGKSEGAQLDAFVAFIKSDAGLLSALKAKKWPSFANLYNGPGYRKNLYDTKLQRAYERHSGSDVS